jgi:glycosyltransferase involved in cell wall biosynthesis
MPSKHAVLIIFANTLAPRHVLMLKSLKAQGWKTSVVAWDREGNRQTPADYQGLIDSWVGVGVPRPTFGAESELRVSRYGLKLSLAVPRYYYEIWKTSRSIEKPDLIICNHLFLLPVAFFSPGKKIYDALELFAYDLAQNYFGCLAPLVQPFWQGLEGLLVSKMDAVFTVDSKDSWLESFYKRYNKRVQVIWNVPSKNDGRGDEATKALPGHYQDRKVIAFVGGIQADSGLWVILKAVASVKERHPEALFLFIGNMKADKKEMEEFIAAHRIGKNVCTLEWLNYREMMAHLSQARIGLVPYQADRRNLQCATGSGRKVFTYMQAGIPIIAPNFVDIGAFVQKEQIGISVDTTDHRELAEAIIQLLDNPGEARAMGARGKRAFLERYNWEREEKKFLDLIEGI